MKYMLDTNICIYTIKQKPEAVIRNFLKRDPNEILFHDKVKIVYYNAASKWRRFRCFLLCVSGIV